MEKKFLIRSAEAGDLEAVNRLLRQVLYVHHVGRPDLFNKVGKKYTDEELLDIFKNPLTPVFVYEKEGEVLGYVFCEIKHQSSGSLKTLTTLYIDDLCVDEKAHRLGVGKALFEYAHKFAKESGCYNITLHVWECNPGAKAFYEAVGLTPQYISMELICKDIPNYLRDS